MAGTNEREHIKRKQEMNSSNPGFYDKKYNDLIAKKRIERKLEAKKSGIKNTLLKAKGESMVGKLKRLVKEPKRDLYAEFKSKHNVK